MNSWFGFPSDDNGARRWLQWMACGSGALIALIVLGSCRRSSSYRPSNSSPSEIAAAPGSELVQDAINALNNLDEYADTDLFPQAALIDEARSIDQRQVLAVVIDDPTKPGEQLNVLQVVSGNGAFLSNGVKPGDVVRYLFREEGRHSKGYAEFLIDDVFNDATVRLTQSFSKPIDVAQRVEVWRYTGGRAQGISERITRWVDRYEPVFGWEPSPDDAMLAQVVDRLSQALRTVEPDASWVADPLLVTLPERLRGLPTVKGLDQRSFDRNDGRLIEEAIWARDVSNQARGGEFTDLALAEKLFDWTVRHVQLENREDTRGVWHRPWQTMLYSRGAVEERAWVFMLLARQQGLDVVMLAVPQGDDGKKLRPWLCGLLSHGQIYLFDPEIGLALPGPEGRGVATLAQAAADDALLRQWDLDSKRRYPFKSADVQKVVALIEASPTYLARRMKLLESRISGPQKVTLSVQPSRLADRLRGVDHVVDVRLWEFPYQTLWEQSNLSREARLATAQEFYPFAWKPQLWKARLLDFRGERPAAGREDELAQGDSEFTDKRAARQLYMQCRPSNEEIDGGVFSEQVKTVMREAKQNATYQLGLLAWESGHYPEAIGFFARQILDANPKSQWASGARYNLGRTYEAAGQIDEAIATYEGTASQDSPQDYGNRLRARRLKEQAKDKSAKNADVR